MSNEKIYNLNFSGQEIQLIVEAFDSFIRGHGLRLVNSKNSMSELKNNIDKLTNTHIFMEKLDKLIDDQDKT